MKRNNLQLIILILTLMLVGSALFFYKWLVLDLPLTPSQNNPSWVIEAKLHFIADNPPIKAEFYIPYDPFNYVVIDENFISHNYGVTANREGINRLAQWSIRRAKGPQTLYYRAVFYRSNASSAPTRKPAPFKPIQLTESQQSAVNALVSQIREKSADTFTFASETIRMLNSLDNNAQTLLGRDKSTKNKVQQAVIILEQANIHAHLVRGLLLKDNRKNPGLSAWLTVYDGNKWIFIDPKTGAQSFPTDFLVWQYGDKPLYKVEGGSNAKFSFTISPSQMSALQMAEDRGDYFKSKIMAISLFHLPLQMQEMYQILLTVPIGAFVILLMRNFVGIKTFGTFMPVLIALAFRDTQLFWGIFMFSFIVALGLVARSYLEHLRLLLVPRLTAILTMVILSMLAISLLCQKFGFERGLSIALFPMVIITMTIERMCIVWDERGFKEAFKSGIGSLFTASLAYLAMDVPELKYLMFMFPELILVLLGFVLWFGQYRGYRLLELIRFKPFLKNDAS